MIKREYLGFILIAFGLIIGLLFTLLGNFIDFHGDFSLDVLSKYGGFISGTVGALFSLSGFLIIYKSFRLLKRQMFYSVFFNLFNQFNNFRTQQIGILYREHSNLFDPLTGEQKEEKLNSLPQLLAARFIM